LVYRDDNGDRLTQCIMGGFSVLFTVSGNTFLGAVPKT